VTIPKRDLLVAEIQDRLSDLAEYDYIMGDIGIVERPWRIFDESCGAIEHEPDADWLAEGALVVALAFHWGVRDGAHSADDRELKLVSKMVQRLRGHSCRTEQIARAIDMVVNEEERMIAASNEIHEKYVRNRLVKVGRGE